MCLPRARADVAAADGAAGAGAPRDLAYAPGAAGQYPASYSDPAGAPVTRERVTTTNTPTEFLRPKQARSGWPSPDRGHRKILAVHQWPCRLTRPRPSSTETRVTTTNAQPRATKTRQCSTKARWCPDRLKRPRPCGRGRLLAVPQWILPFGRLTTTTPIVAVRPTASASLLDQLRYFFLQACRPPPAASSLSRHSALACRQAAVSMSAGWRAAWQALALFVHHCS